MTLHDDDDDDEFCIYIPLHVTKAQTNISSIVQVALAYLMRLVLMVIDTFCLMFLTDMVLLPG